MDSDLTTALVISGVGLLMLFAALAFLYGLIYAMTVIFKDRPDDVEQKGPAPAAGADRGAAHAKRRAAVVAVALARAQLQSSPAGSPETEIGIGPWGQYHRHRQLGLTLCVRARTSR